MREAQITSEIMELTSGRMSGNCFLFLQRWQEKSSTENRLEQGSQSLKGHTIAEWSLSQVGKRWWLELKALSSSPPPLFTVHMVSVRPSTVSLSWFPTYKMQSSIILPVLPILRTNKKTVRSWLSLLWAFMHVFSFQCPLAPNPH